VSDVVAVDTQLWEYAWLMRMGLNTLGGQERRGSSGLCRQVDWRGVHGVVWQVVFGGGILPPLAEE